MSCKREITLKEGERVLRECGFKVNQKHLLENYSVLVWFKAFWKLHDPVSPVIVCHSYSHSSPESWLNQKQWVISSKYSKWFEVLGLIPSNQPSCAWAKKSLGPLFSRFTSGVSLSPPLVLQHDDIQDQYSERKGGGCRKYKREEVRQKTREKKRQEDRVTNLQESIASFYNCNSCKAQSSFPRTEPEQKINSVHMVKTVAKCLNFYSLQRFTGLDWSSLIIFRGCAVVYRTPKYRLKDIGTTEYRFTLNQSLPGFGAWEHI